MCMRRFRSSGTKVNCKRKRKRRKATGTDYLSDVFVLKDFKLIMDRPKTGFVTIRLSLLNKNLPPPPPLPRPLSRLMFFKLFTGCSKLFQGMGERGM